MSLHSDSEAPRTEQDNPDKNTSSEKEPNSLPKEAALPPDLRHVTEPPPSLEGTDNLLQLVEEYDEDGNYKLDRKEWLNFYNSQGGNPIHAYKAFNDSDVNHDGFINFNVQDELQRVEDIMKMMQSEDVKKSKQ